MLRASVSRLACRATNGGVMALGLVYKGSVIKSVSGTMPKTDLLAAAGKASGTGIVVDCETVSGGHSGAAAGSSNSYSGGGRPGIVAMVRKEYSELPDTMTFVVGAGGKARPSQTTGGATSITGIVSSASPASTSLGANIDRPTGPGAGSARSRNERGGHSNASKPDLMLEGGAHGNAGRNASTPFQHGSAGGSSGTDGVGGGKGGFPGGGGGHGVGGYQKPDSWYGGDGGAGVVRFHIYAWERV